MKDKQKKKKRWARKESKQKEAIKLAKVVSFKR